jgi:hypothetical protein
MTKSLTERMLDSMRYGFWVRMKLHPFRAVRWEPDRHEDGRQTFRGKNWVEVLAHTEDREPERFHAADVELAGPHEWMHYYPAANEPVCGWMVEPGKYCPRSRAVTGDAIQPFCPKHQAELTAGEESNDRPDNQPPGTAAVPAAD